MLERASQEPARHIDFMELQYLCLVLGFAGKYNTSDRGRTALTDIQHETFRLIRRERGGEKPGLSLRWRGLEDKRNPVIRYLPWWVVAAAALSLVAITFAVLAARLRSEARPVVEALSKVADIGLTAAPALPAYGPTIKGLLVAEERSGLLQVEERGAQSFVTPQADDLFASGSATVNPQFAPTLRRIAEAINQVPGRVVVTGHTDDQPVRSARFGDNFELSRERAVAVARILQQSVANPGRIMWNGVGSLRPKYTPVSDPQNRARNRRVEIIHVREN
jgi:type VI secretion system protein ImpK